MTDLERTFLVMAGADAAFDLLADPVRLPEWVPTIQLADSIAIEGEADPDAKDAITERDGAPEAGFLADRRTRTITWGRPDHDYHGAIEVREGTTSTSNVTVRLHVRPGADEAAVTRVFEQALASIRRLAMTR